MPRPATKSSTTATSVCATSIPLAGLQLLGERRNTYCESVTERRTQRGNLQFHCLWRLKDATELEWLDEADMPTYLIEEFEKRLTGATLVVGV